MFLVELKRRCKMWVSSGRDGLAKENWQVSTEWQQQSWKRDSCSAVLLANAGFHFQTIYCILQSNFHWIFFCFYDRRTNDRVTMTFFLKSNFCFFPSVTYGCIIDDSPPLFKYLSQPSFAEPFILGVLFHRVS